MTGKEKLLGNEKVRFLIVFELCREKTFCISTLVFVGCFTWLVFSLF